ncbi:hypothetical protein GCM10008904_11530 [Paraclostridium ghonii]|uniref:DUF1284 domain-containing protein n=1 Tax=Paraclostridium ghonii TaxID=29358 RepID=A0ABU0N189_9FIRM|nr:DUF1284 domain-containing protein [Paeniclostridium ghonii]MDQ0556933.1 hypothetical protein [Paeniclostridium ghonii]
MLEIRPHHLFCMKAFIGRGYSKEFTDNMIETISKLNENKNQNIKITANLDSVCSKCPNNIDNEHCVTGEEVLQMDNKVMDYFNITEGVYEYEKIESLIYNNINEDIIEEICKNCSWYKKTNCKKLILLKSKGAFNE